MNWQWWNAAQCAEFLGVCTRQFRERTCKAAGFPVPFRADGKGHPRWRSDEIREWSDRSRQSRAATAETEA